ncbi:MAG: hypothetical protein ACLFUJ_04915 [Phycisphaerae bacterium]
MSSSKSVFNARRAIRRQFIHPVGSSNCRLAGWMEVPYVLTGVPVGPGSPGNPETIRLGTDVLVQPTRSGANLYRQDRRNLGPVAQVNPAVRYLLDELTEGGKIPAMADSLCRGLGLTPMEFEEHCLAIARCLNSLSAGDLLAEPFCLAMFCQQKPV